MFFPLFFHLMFMICLTIFVLYFFMKLFECKCNHLISNVLNKHIVVDQKNNNNPIKILDLGCGSCCLYNLLDEQKKLKTHITSLDVVNAGKCFIPDLFDGENIPFQDKEFDLGVCAFVLHHTQNQEKLLQELKRTCKKIIIFEDTPKTSQEWNYAYKHAQSDWGSCESCFHSVEDWIKIMEKNDLPIKHIEMTNKWICPFAKKPFLYPVTKTIFIL